ncbi:thioesterase family protein [Rossellomorea sp. BNER]|uniref:thioesterase family protein n=1 Tax=Rossellomorea sp. BNER TaxID=2962031 RepID=UPI003AF2AE3E|nr:thioesterase [Rossellomorea sp. BNER]
MKSGMKVGLQASITFTVTPDMFAQFEGKVVHPVYSTVSMVYHMEWASRKIILPYLEDEEEGMGGAVTIQHLAPSGEGSTVTVTATVTKIIKNVVITMVEARNQREIIGTGEVKQVVLPKSKIGRLIDHSLS